MKKSLLILSRRKALGFYYISSGQCTFDMTRVRLSLLSTKMSRALAFMFSVEGRRRERGQGRRTHEGTPTQASTGLLQERHLKHRSRSGNCSNTVWFPTCTFISSDSEVGWRRLRVAAGHRLERPMTPTKCPRCDPEILGTRSRTDRPKFC